MRTLGGLIGAGVLAVLAAGLVVLNPAAAPAASAAEGGHGGLVASDPKAGETVTIAPLFIRLDFGHPLLELGVAVQVTGPTGAVVSAGAPRLYPTTVTQALAGRLPAGRYQVSWRVTGEDGLPIAGQFAFTADEAGEASAAPAALPASTPAPVVAGRSGGPGLLAAAGGVLGVVGVAALVSAAVGAARRRRQYHRG